MRKAKTFFGVGKPAIGNAVLTCLMVWMVAVLACLPFDVSGSHASGSDIRYRYISGLKYEIEVSFYRDCGGVSEPNSIAINCMSLAAGYSQNITAQKIGASTNGQEVTVPCTGSPTQCSGGISGGIRRWVYKGTVTLPSRQSDWVFSYSVCCRNCVVTTISNPCSANSLLYVEATLDNLNIQWNDSPRFSRVPVAYVCTGQTFRYNHGAIDTNGDSLVYELIAPKTTRNSNVNFISPYSAIHPMASNPSLLLDPVTGDFVLSPAQIQVGVMAIRVKEFRQGLLIGSVIRDMQLHAQPCSNVLPVLSGINGTGMFNTSACAGDTLRLQIPTFDPDSSQAVSVTCDVDIPGANFTVSTGPRPVVFFEWAPSAVAVRPEPYVFTVTVQDDACPYNGLQVYSFRIWVDFPAFQVSSTPVSCAGSFDGTASVVSTNALNETYLWNTGATSPVIQGLQPGTYTISVTNTASGCQAQRSVVVDNAAPISAFVSVSPASCPSASDGSVQVVPQGGVAPIQVTWVAGTTNMTSPPSAPGNYSLHLVDAAGCEFDTSVTIGFDYQLAIASSVIHNRCKSDSTGSILLTTINGQGPFSFSWSTGDSTAALQGLQAGLYSVTVTDQAGCLSALTVPVEEPSSSLVIAVEPTPVGCRGDSTGRAEVFVAGAQGTFSVVWSNGASGQVLSGLTAGSYTVIVVDSAGCTVTSSVLVQEPAHGIRFGSTVSDANCAGDSSGSISISPAGGSASYSIQWSDGRSGWTIHNLPAGVYHAVVTDSNGCSTVGSFEVSQPSAPLSLQYDVSPSHCLDGVLGSIAVVPSGGTPPYHYDWKHGSTNSIVSVSKGLYSVKVVDGKGCFVQREIVVEDASEVSLLSEGDPMICPGSSIRLYCSASTEASYQWYFNGEPLIGATASYFVTRAAGHYSVRIVSGCGSFESIPLEITSRIPPQVSISNDVILCAGESTSLEVTGGVSYSWTPEEGLDYPHSASPTCNPSTSTVYTVMVTDEAGCTAAATVNVTILCDEPDVSNGFSPNGDGKNDTFFIEGLEDYPENVIHIYNRWGTLVFKQKPYENGWNGISNVNGTIMNRELPNGTYFYILDLGMNRKPVQGFVYLKRD